MADKQLSFDEDARVSLLSGVEQLRRVVGITLGPSGRNVMLSPYVRKPGGVQRWRNHRQGS